MSELQSANNRILVIDDTESIHNDFRKTLAPAPEDHALADEASVIFDEVAPLPRATAFHIDSALQGQDGLNKVRKAVERGQPYAVAFVDMRMPPGWDGVKTIEQLWKADPHLQVVICTAYSDYSWDEVIHRLGVNDRLLLLKKPFDPPEVSQLAVALSQKWTATLNATLKLDELERLVEVRTAELHHAATHDRLTGLANRSGLTERLRGAIAAAEPAGAGFGVLFLDFDRFKIINDSLGHETGDDLLRAIAGRIAKVLGGEPQPPRQPHKWLAARLGGDEFVVLLEGLSNRDDVSAVAARLMDALRMPYSLGGREVYSTASVGITTSAFDYCRPEDVLRDADAAMYCAKTSGKDRCMVFDRSMHDQTLTRLQVESDLRRALLDEEFVVHYQPIVALESGRILGFESLVRWNHPGRGMVAPSEFVPVAEETGLILPLGQWVLETAVRQLRRWQDEFPADPPLYMSVNLSKRQVLEPGMIQQVADLIADAGIAPGSLRLEVTESIIMDKVEAVAPILARIKALGVGLSMDDFGTGHSSLTCLQQFPIDTLKIDRAFIAHMESNLEYTAIVQAIVSLAGNLGLSVIAEGIETREQLAQIQAMECDAGQGFLFAKPMAPDACRAMLANGPTVR